MLDYVAVGKRIKEARIQKGLTQEKLAENAQVSTSYISKIETADTKLSLQVIIDIANALQTSVDALLADNVTYPPVYLKKDFEPLLDNMTPNELMIVRETVKALRQALLSQRQKD